MALCLILSLLTLPLLTLCPLCLTMLTLSLTMLTLSQTMLTLSLTMLTLSLSLPWCHIPRNAMDSSTKLMSIARASLLRRGFASEALSLPGVRVSLLPLSMLNVRCRLYLVVPLLRCVAGSEQVTRC